jgi:hypothetical protein
MLFDGKRQAERFLAMFRESQSLAATREFASLFWHFLNVVDFPLAFADLNLTRRNSFFHRIRECRNLRPSY